MYRAWSKPEVGASAVDRLTLASTCPSKLLFRVAFFFFFFPPLSHLDVALILAWPTDHRKKDPYPTDDRSGVGIFTITIQWQCSRVFFFFF